MHVICSSSRVPVNSRRSTCTVPVGATCRSRNLDLDRLDLDLDLLDLDRDLARVSRSRDLDLEI